MQNNVAKDDLEKEVRNMLFKIATQDFGLNPTPNIHNRWLWERVGKVKEAVLDTGANITIIKKAFSNVVKDCMEDGKARLPEPIIWKGSILRELNLEKKQNVKVDDKLQEGNVQTINRAKVKTDYINKIQASGVAWCEDQWIANESLPNNNWMRLDFWAAVSRQDQKAMAIINSYEERSNRERN